MQLVLPEPVELVRREFAVPDRVLSVRDQRLHAEAENLKHSLNPLGFHTLRGVGAPEEIFTLPADESS